ncbi:MAG: nucleotidyltransferase domain-containing protein [Candidatus Woesearchaeota archaeon]
MVSISFEYKKRPVEYHFHEEDIDITKQFAEKLKTELGDLLKAVVLFGSAARGKAQEESDIDVLLVVNDMTIVYSNEVISSLRVIIENVAASVSQKFHITTMKLGDFWDYLHKADPIVVNILREGRAVYDEGFFSPAQSLLDSGKIRPTKEAVWAYYLRAPKTIKTAEQKLLQSVVDLYWAVIDAAHAALMHIGVVPGAPHEIADLLEKHFVSKRLIEKRYVKILRSFYHMAKEIGHQHLLHTSGKNVDEYIEEARDFVKKMRFLISHNPDKLKQL